MQKKKNLRLMLMLIAVVAAIGVVEFVEGDNNSLGVDKKLFQLDPNREINRVVLEGPDETSIFDFRNGRWRLNDSLYLDQSMRDVFFSVVSQLEIRRKVLQSRQDSIANYLNQSGVLTTISFGGEQIQQYRVGGNSQQQVTWVMGEDGVPYQVHIPGYQSYVAGIFNVPARDWRSRFLLEVNFALIRSISISYPEKAEELVLNYENEFFSVAGVNSDSLKVAEFLESLSFLQANQFLDKNSNNLSQNQPLANLKIDLVNGKSITIPFFTDPKNGKIALARLEDGTLAEIDSRLLNNLFKIPADFE